MAASCKRARDEHEEELPQRHGWDCLLHFGEVLRPQQIEVLTAHQHEYRLTYRYDDVSADALGERAAPELHLLLQNVGRSRAWHPGSGYRGGGDRGGGVEVRCMQGKIMYSLRSDVTILGLEGDGN